MGQIKIIKLHIVTDIKVQMVIKNRGMPNRGGHNRHHNKHERRNKQQQQQLQQQQRPVGCIPGNVLGSIVQQARRARNRGGYNKTTSTPQHIRFGNPIASPNVNNNSLKRTYNAAADSPFPTKKKICLEARDAGVFGNLTEEAESLALEHSQTPELLEKKQRLRSVLTAVIREKFPGIGVYLVGSSCNGFATDSSDADFCVMFDENRNTSQKSEA